MGILNVTPDSFSDGGDWIETGPAIEHAVAMVEAGAAIVDIGGESTRPGASEVSEQQELDRVLPIIEGLAGQIDAAISVDTGKPNVMRAAVSAGANMINDVYGLRQEGALAAAASLEVPVCVMHMQGSPRSMQTDPSYRDVVDEVESFLLERAAACRQAGIAPDHVILDPGFGFGKTLDHNVALFHAIPRLAGHGHPLLVGVSRKSMLGQITGRAVDGRVFASVAAAQEAVRLGADIVRVHDVAGTVDALRVFSVLSC